MHTFDNCSNDYIVTLECTIFPNLICPESFPSKQFQEIEKGYPNKNIL
jgi:hypothetical protein